MASAIPVMTRDFGSSDGSMIQAIWTITTAGIDGVPIQYPEYADRTFQCSGTWGAATLAIQGSNDNVTYFTLSNAAGATAATFTADGMKSVIELPRFIKPILTAVGAGATITVTLVARRANPMRQ